MGDDDDESTTHHRPYYLCGQATDSYFIDEPEWPVRARTLSVYYLCRDEGTTNIFRITCSLWREVEHDATVSFALADHHGVVNSDMPVTACEKRTVSY